MSHSLQINQGLTKPLQFLDALRTGGLPQHNVFGDETKCRRQNVWKSGSGPFSTNQSWWWQQKTFCYFWIEVDHRTDSYSRWESWPEYAAKVHNYCSVCQSHYHAFVLVPRWMAEGVIEPRTLSHQHYINSPLSLATLECPIPHIRHNTLTQGNTYPNTHGK